MGNKAPGYRPVQRNEWECPWWSDWETMAARCVPQRSKARPKSDLQLSQWRSTLRWYSKEEKVKFNFKNQYNVKFCVEINSFCKMQLINLKTYFFSVLSELFGLGVARRFSDFVAQIKSLARNEPKVNFKRWVIDYKYKLTKNLC